MYSTQPFTSTLPGAATMSPCPLFSAPNLTSPSLPGGAPPEQGCQRYARLPSGPAALSRAKTARPPPWGLSGCLRLRSLSTTRLSGIPPAPSPARVPSARFPRRAPTAASEPQRHLTTGRRGIETASLSPIRVTEDHNGSFFVRHEDRSFEEATAALAGRELLSSIRSRVISESLINLYDFDRVRFWRVREEPEEEHFRSMWACNAPARAANAARALFGGVPARGGPCGCPARSPRDMPARHPGRKALRRLSPEGSSGY